MQMKQFFRFIIMLAVFTLMMFLLFGAGFYAGEKHFLETCESLCRDK